MATGRVLLASWSMLTLTVLCPSPSPAIEERRLREYEIRLAAHRRELMQRENDLDAAHQEIRVLKKRTRGRIESRPAAALEPAITPPTAAAASAPFIEKPDDRTEQIIDALQNDLSVERENRATLEREFQRLLAEPRDSEAVEPLRRSLESANAGLLVLNQRLSDEHRQREALEVALERVRGIAGVAPAEGWLDRFETTMRERRSHSERLERELREANEAVVALRARLESLTTSSNDPAALQALEEENAKLRGALAATERMNAELTKQAELASHLAEMLYAQPR